MNKFYMNIRDYRIVGWSSGIEENKDYIQIDEADARAIEGKTMSPKQFFRNEQLKIAQEIANAAPGSAPADKLPDGTIAGSGDDEMLANALVRRKELTDKTSAELKEILDARQIPYKTNANKTSLVELVLTSDNPSNPITPEGGSPTTEPGANDGKE